MAFAPDPVRAAAAARSQVMSGNILGVGAVLTWAMAFPAAEILLQDWEPLALIVARFALVTVVLVPLWAMIEGPRALISARWGYGTLMGGLTFGLGAYLLLVAQSLTDAVTVAILAAMMPIAGAVIELIEGTRRLRITFVAGLGLSVIGGIVATGGGSVGALGLGAMTVVVAVTLFAMGSHFSVRDLPDLTPLGRTAVTLAGCFGVTATLLLGSQFFGGATLPTHNMDATQWGLLAIYGLAGLALSQVLWIASVGRLGVAVASIHINLAPFYVMLLMLALGEDWNFQRALGAGIVIAGVVLAQKRKRPVVA